MKPKLNSIAKNQPVCQFPREDFNRITTILNYLKGGRGIDIKRVGDRWTISVDVGWLEGKIEADTSQEIDSVANEVSANVEGTGSFAYLSLNDGSGATADAQTWTRGDKNASGKSYAPITRMGYRFYFDRTTHILWVFSRLATFDENGRLKSLGAESGEALFTTAPENF